MMRSNTLIYGALLTGALVLAPPFLAAEGDRADEATLTEVRQETRELLQALEAYSARQRDEALEKSREALNELDTRIDALESRIDRQWDELTRPAQQDARKSLRILRRLRLRVAEYYGGLQASSADAWDEMKEGFSNAYEDLYQAWQRSVKEFEQGDAEG